MMGKENREAWEMAPEPALHRQRCRPFPSTQHTWRQAGRRRAAEVCVSACMHTHTPCRRLQDTHQGPQAVPLRDEAQEVPQPMNTGPKRVQKAQPGLQLVRESHRLAPDP